MFRRILFQGRDLTALSEREMRRVRGAGIGLAFQEPGAALNPVLKIGTQVGESLRIHKGLSRKDAWREAGVPPRKVATLCRIAGAVDKGLFEGAGFEFENRTWKPGARGCCFLSVRCKRAA